MNPAHSLGHGYGACFGIWEMGYWQAWYKQELEQRSCGLASPFSGLPFTMRRTCLSWSLVRKGWKTHEEDMNTTQELQQTLPCTAGAQPTDAM